MNSDRLAGFRTASCLSLGTYRRNGAVIVTPVWFAEDRGVLYVRTFARTGKVKRLHHDPRVRVAVCDRAEHPSGEWFDGEARVIEGAEAERAYQLIDHKYHIRHADVGYQRSLGEIVMLAMYL